MNISPAWILSPQALRAPKHRQTLKSPVSHSYLPLRRHQHHHRRRQRGLDSRRRRRRGLDTKFILDMMHSRHH